MNYKNKPAFPRSATGSAETGPIDKGAEGMTLREHYAGLAMQGMVANHKNDYEPRWAVAFADALIAELQREDNNE